MNAELAAEAMRLNRKIERVRWGDPHLYVSEVPLRLHEKGPDSGHGLGGPALHPKLIAYLKDAGVCFCDETWPDGQERQHACDRRFADKPARFQGSKFQNHPRRLKRALRQLRLIAPQEFDAIYLMLARGRTWHQAFEQINSSRSTKGRDLYSEMEFMVLTIAGFDKLVEAF